MAPGQRLVVATDVRKVLTVANLRSVRRCVYTLSGWLSKLCYMSRLHRWLHCNVRSNPGKLSRGAGLYELLYSWLQPLGQLQPVLNQYREGYVKFVLEIHVEVLAFGFLFNVTSGRELASWHTPYGMKFG
jgi:hypothetical protein